MKFAIKKKIEHECLSCKKLLHDITIETHEGFKELFQGCVHCGDVYVFFGQKPVKCPYATLMFKENLDKIKKEEK